jgi:hypothetical protein
MAVNGQLIGAAGVHFVAARLNAKGLHAAPTIRNVPGVDLLVSDREGLHAVALQVKTSAYAARHHKRKNNEIFQYQFAGKYVTEHSPKLFYAYVDLKNFDEALPDIYLIPSKIIAAWYAAGRKKEEWKFARLHETSSWFAPYRNNFSPLFKALKLKEP